MSKNEKKKGIISLISERYGFSKDDRETLKKVVYMAILLGFFTGAFVMTLCLMLNFEITNDFTRTLICGIFGLSFLGIFTSMIWINQVRNNLEVSLCQG